MIAISKRRKKNVAGTKSDDNVETSVYWKNDLQNMQTKWSDGDTNNKKTSWSEKVVRI